MVDVALSQPSAVADPSWRSLRAPQYGHVVVRYILCACFVRAVARSAIAAGRTLLVFIEFCSFLEDDRNGHNKA